MDAGVTEMPSATPVDETNQLMNGIDSVKDTITIGIVSIWMLQNRESLVSLVKPNILGLSVQDTEMATTLFLSALTSMTGANTTSVKSILCS